jgi:tetratricopeptide (TPR) repeat protein
MCYHTGQLLSSGGQRAERITYWKRGKTALEELLRDDPNNPEYRADLAGVCRDLGESVFVSDEQEGRTLIEGAEQLAEDLTVQFPKVPAYRFQLIRCRSLLAKNDRDRDPAAAESMYRGAMELAEAAVQEYPGYRLAEDLWFDVGQYWVPLATARGKYAEVEGSLRRLIAALEARVQDNPDGYARVQLARICHLTANGFFEQQDMAAVEELERRAAPAYAESARRDPSRPWCWEVAAKCEMRLAEIFEADGRIGEAYDAYRRAGEAADSLARRFPDGRDYVRLFPDHRDCWITWSWTVSAEERFKARHDLESTEVVRRRIETFESQLEENPQDRVARTRLAFACHQLSTRLADDAAGSELFAARAAVLWRELAAEHRADVILECAKVLASISGVEEAEAAIRAASEQDSSDALANNNFAWFLATCETQPLRDPALAVRLAKKAVGLAPKDGNIWNTLGVAQYRAGDWQATIDGLQKAMDLRNGGDSSDWFFLAMAYWQLDRKDEARTWFDKAVEWMDENAPTNEELLRFRAEAGKLLGITEPQSASDEQPDDDAPPTTNN